jgi:chemotaxis protein MotB
MAARRQKRRPEVEHENAERWLLTYADMITLLMVLFIVLFSIGQVDLKKFEQLRNGLASTFGTPTPVLPSQGSEGVLDGGARPSGDGLENIDPKDAVAQVQAQAAASAAATQAMQQTQKEVSAALALSGLGDDVTSHLESRGLVLSVVSDKVLFDLGRADLKPEGRQVLDGLAVALRDLPNDLAIEGHTDNRPLNHGALFDSNWELSTARATSVLRYFVDQLGIPAARVSASGYADQRPLVPNDSAENQARNRRVEIVVLSNDPVASSQGGR